MSATSQVSAANKCHSEQPRRTPRPPNAFFLYRSDFLKRRAIPPEVEKRQQNLSRIAGQCWNMLPETEKAIWHSKAAIVRAEYLVRYPPNGTGPFPKDTNRLLAKAKRRGSVNNPRRPSGRSRGRLTQPPYYEGLLTTQHDSTFSSPTSQASLISTPAPKSPLSTTAALSPPLLSHGLPSFASHTNSSSQDSLLATTENSIRNEIDDPLGPLVFEAPQGVSYTTRDSENVGILFFPFAERVRLTFPFRHQVRLVLAKSRPLHFSRMKIALELASLSLYSNNIRRFMAIQLLNSPGLYWRRLHSRLHGTTWRIASHWRPTLVSRTMSLILISLRRWSLCILDIVIKPNTFW